MDNELSEYNCDTGRVSIPFEFFQLNQIEENKHHDAFQIMQKQYFNIISFAENKFCELFDFNEKLVNSFQVDLEFLSVLNKYISKIQVVMKKESELITKFDTLISNKVSDRTKNYNLEKEIEKWEKDRLSKDQLQNTLRIRLKELFSKCNEEDLKTISQNLSNNKDEIEINIIEGFVSLLNQRSQINSNLIDKTIGNYESVKRYMENFNETFSFAFVFSSPVFMPFSEYLLKFPINNSNLRNRNAFNPINELKFSSNPKMILKFFKEGLKVILEKLVYYVGKIDPNKSAPTYMSQKYKHLINYGLWSIALAELILCTRNIEQIKKYLKQIQNEIIKSKKEAIQISKMKFDIDFSMDLCNENLALESIKNKSKNITKDLKDFLSNGIPSEIRDPNLFFNEINKDLTIGNKEINDLYDNFEKGNNNKVRMTNENIRQIKNEIKTEENHNCWRLLYCYKKKED